MGPENIPEFENDDELEERVGNFERSIGDLSSPEQELAVKAEPRLHLNPESNEIGEIGAMGGERLSEITIQGPSTESGRTQMVTALKQVQDLVQEYHGVDNGLPGSWEIREIPGVDMRFMGGEKHPSKTSHIIGTYRFVAEQK